MQYLFISIIFRIFKKINNLKHRTMKTFKDLIFRPHAVFKEAVHARLKFDNGTYISVVGGHPTQYGNGKTSFEIKSTITDRKNEVIGWLSVGQITTRMKYLQGLRCQCLTNKS